MTYYDLGRAPGAEDAGPEGRAPVNVSMTDSSKMIHVERTIADFDACSLYPSATNRKDGYLTGLPEGRAPVPGHAHEGLRRPRGSY